MTAGISGLRRVLWCGVWLVFLAYPIGDILSRHHSTAWLVAAWAGLAIFVALYLRAMWVALSVDLSARPQPPVGWLLALVLFTVAAVGGFGGAWDGMIIYLGVATGSTLRPRPAMVALAGLAVFTAGVGWHADLSASNIAFIGFLTTALGFSMLGLRRMLQLIVELQDTRHEVARLTATEQRLRFSRDLHDVLGHSLSVIALKSQVARRTMATDPDAASAALSDVEAAARQSLRDVRELVSGYRQRSLDEELAAASELLVAAGIIPRIDRPTALPSGEADRLLAWAVREGTTNIIRHSQASRCAITVGSDGAGAHLEIADDGGGGNEISTKGSGLRGLRERMEAAGGRLDAGPGSEGGFCLAVHLPEPGPP